VGDVRDPQGHPAEPGAYVGRRPERQADSIPGGVRPDDERIAANSTVSEDVVGGDRPDGHREGPPADDAAVREAGMSR
jgi:hypothetical protein